MSAEVATLPSLTSRFDGWEQAWPHPTRPWTTRRPGAWGVWTPEVGEPEAVAGDPALPGLGRWLADGAELRSWRVGRRAVLAHPSGWVKVARPRRLPAIAESWRVASTSTVRTPNVIESSSDSLVLEPLLGDSANASDPRTWSEAQLVAIVAAVAELHHTRVPDGVLGAWAADEPGSVVAQAGRAASDVGWLERVAGRLPEVPLGSLATPQAVVHGDLHDKNLLFVEDGSVAMLDLDGLTIGPAETDYGNFAAHLALRVLQRGGGAVDANDQAKRFVDVAVRASGADRHLIEILERHTLFRLAALYFFRRVDRAIVVPLLELAARPLH